MDTIYNKMLGRGFIIPSDIAELDASVILGETSHMDSEVTVRIIRKNRTKGRVKIIKMVPDSIVINTDIEDTYVRQSLPYMSFKDSNVLKSSMFNGESFFGMMRFNTMDQIVKGYGPQLLSLKLVLKPVDKVIQNISVFELDSQFKAYNVSYENHPNATEKLGDMQYNAFKNEYEIDVTLYAKQIIDGVRSHNGFTFNSETGINVYSSESEYGKPKLILEYIDPNKFQTENEIPAEIEFRESIGLNVELELEEPYPVLNSELIFTKDSVASSVLLGVTDGLDAEIVIRPTIGEEGISTELILSKDAVNAEIAFNESTILLSEVDYLPPDESLLDVEIKGIMLTSARPAMVNLAFPGKSEMDAELKCYSYGKENLDAEVTLDNKFGSVLNSCVSLFVQDKLDTEMKLYVPNRESSIDVELEFTRTYMPAKVRFSPSVILNSEVDLLFNSKLDAEVSFELFESLDACVNLYVDSHVDAEVNLGLASISRLDAQVDILGASNLHACVNLYTMCHIGAEMNLALVGASDLEAEVQLITSDSLNAEVNVYAQHGLNSELELNFENKLNVCVSLYIESALNSCVSLFVQDKLDAEMRVALVGMSSIESDVEFVNSDTLYAEVNLEVPGEAYLDACVNTYTSNRIDAEVQFSIFDESKLDAQMKLNFHKILNSEMLFLKEQKSELDAVVIYSIITDTRLDAEVSLIKKLKAKIIVTQK